MSVSHQTPYGKGSKTIVEAAVIWPWELNANQFELRNLLWNTVLGKVIERVTADLDALGGIKATPYKMILYEKESMFKEYPVLVLLIPVEYLADFHSHPLRNQMKL